MHTTPRRGWSKINNDKNKTIIFTGGRTDVETVVVVAGNDVVKYPTYAMAAAGSRASREGQ